MATQTLNENDLLYRVRKLSCYIGEFGDKVAREFLNGHSCAKNDLKKLAILVASLQAARCYVHTYSLVLLEDSTTDTILLESGDCLLLEQQS